jgi:phage minor structural protein
LIPILYRNDELNFTSNGIGRLVDCISCVVTEERNGIYELEFTYPITGRFYQQMHDNGGVVGVIHDDRHDVQPFDIYKFSAPIDGVVTFNAHHISYRLSNVIVDPFTAESCASALQGLKQNSISTNPFSFWTDKPTSGNFKNDHPSALRALLGGQEGSILDVYGAGDYQFDKYEVRLYASRGNNSGVTIRYGKNMTDITHERDESGAYSAVAPYWQGENELVTLPEGYIVSPTLRTQLFPWTDENGNIITGTGGDEIEFNAPIITPAPLDMTSYFETAPTVEELRQAAENFMSRNRPWRPSENITVDFVQLWQTPEYENVAALQRVALCDTVSVYYPELGVIQAEEKVIKTVYNVLLERYDSIELGELRTTFAETVAGDFEEELQQSTTALRRYIDYATDAITGGLGGYVVLTLNANKEPQEILIMDTPDINTAVNVWRWNQGGLGHSHSGYAGPFDDVAITQDGKINASMITTGFLLANYIRGGTLTLGGYDDINGVFQILDANGNVITTGDNEGITTTALNATDYLYVDGDERSYFKVPFKYAGLYTGYLEMSTSGFVIVIDNPSYRTQILSDVLDSVAMLRFISGNGNETRISPDSAASTDGTNRSSITPTSIGVGAANGSITGGGAVFTRTGATVQCGSGSGYFFVYGNFQVAQGTKSRIANADQYGDRLLYCYETPSPLFGDVGEGKIAEDGACYVWLDPVFAQTIATDQYQVFLQKYGEGDCYIAERKAGYFIVKGTPGLSFGWELKAKQADFDQKRLDKFEQPREEEGTDYGAEAAQYITELNKGRLSA